MEEYLKLQTFLYEIQGISGLSEAKLRYFRGLSDEISSVFYVKQSQAGVLPMSEVACEALIRLSVSHQVFDISLYEILNLELQLVLEAEKRKDSHSEALGFLYRAFQLRPADFSRLLVLPLETESGPRIKAGILLSFQLKAGNDSESGGHFAIEAENWYQTLHKIEVRSAGLNVGLAAGFKALGDQFSLNENPSAALCYQKATEAAKRLAGDFLRYWHTSSRASWEGL